MGLDDHYNLQRFLAAQDAGGTYARALAELEDGAKRSHWMWFIFPQIAGLGQSTTSRTYAISSLDEAKEYLRHRLLGSRLVEAAGKLVGQHGRTAEAIFGSVDAQKLRSSMTLFLRAAPDNMLFQQILDQYFDGEPDAATDRLLRDQQGGL